MLSCRKDGNPALHHYLLILKLTMDSKEALLAKIKEREAQFQMADQENRAWNQGKYKTSSNAELSKILVTSLHNEIIRLREELAQIEAQ